MRNIKIILVSAIILTACSGNEEESDSSEHNETPIQETEDSTIYTSGLLLGIEDHDLGNRTYWIKFSNKGAEVDSIMGAFITPQKDGFYIVQQVLGEAAADCDYEDYDGTQTSGQCSWSVSELLVTKVDKYESNFKKLKERVKSLAKESAYCGESGSDYEFPIFIGNGFVEYTVGGESSECAPDGPGGGFDKDTIIPIGSKRISPYASDHMNKEQIDEAYAQLSKWFVNDGVIDTASYSYFSPQEMLVYFDYLNGRVSMSARNVYGRNLQDTWEETVLIGDASDELQSNEFPEYGKQLVKGVNEVSNYIISPIDSTYGMLTYKEEKIRFKTYPQDDIIHIMNVGWASVVMAEWCNAANIDKWQEKVDEVKSMVKE
ncbi:hypothetical protein K6119_12000 [Paracrocinitomix mangrovi]|uniref:hypothetical protein n=1 Tax=Paracrocinitomix mangrovi TaxID=2862509 RepID=UPI001C8E0DF2|nr:hypothetical protein [Paracrocinitomix mangrovi]UKN00454.1 hypothetical protein K6119_12000 [Paracrocinitomix mangrovi]